VDADVIEESHNPVVHSLAGAAAGTMEHCAMYPVDTIKTHLQASRSMHMGTVLTARSLVNLYGFGGLFRGIGAVLMGAVPAHALSFTAYENLKLILRAHQEDASGELKFIRNSLAGIGATLVHDAVITPMDVVKQKMQLRAVPYRSIFHCAQVVLRQEGVSALYAGYTTTFCMNIPYATVYYGTYESLKTLFSRRRGKGVSNTYDPFAHVLSGAGAGISAAAITTPMDVAKTRLQTRSDSHQHYNGMLRTLRDIWQVEGWRGLTRGMVPRMVFHSSSAAIMWTTYEAVKAFMDGRMTDGTHPPPK